MDLISRQAAIDATWFEPSYTDPLNVLTEVRDRLKELPSALPDIILCEDCKYWERESICEGYCHATGLGGVDEDHFCGYAEGREDGQTT